MKKLLVLLLAASAVGVLFSRGPKGEGTAANTPAASPPQVSPEPEPRPPAWDAFPETPQEPAAVPQPPAFDAPPGDPEREYIEELDVRRSCLADVLTGEGQVMPVGTDVSPAAPTGPPVAESAFDTTLKEAQNLLRSGQKVAARKLLTGLYLEANGDDVARARDLLDEINKDLVFNPRCVDGAEIYVVKAGDNLTKIGKELGVPWRAIARVNGVNPNRLRIGQKLKVLKGTPRVVAWKSRFKLALLIGDAYVKEYPIGIGREGRTPTCEFVVAEMLTQPRWYKPGGGVVEYGQPGNLLGERWIGFADEPGASGFGIHGTNDEEAIGTACSSGCLRMHNADVIELYDFMQPGARIDIRD